MAVYCPLLPPYDKASLPNQDTVPDNAPVRLVYHTNGGHCGFSTTQSSMLGTQGSPVPVPSHGWLAQELARAVAHVHFGTASEGQEQQS
jgi:hypothetical protein